MVTKNFKLFLAIILLLIILPSILALDTKIVVKSQKNQKITLNFMDNYGKGTLEKGLLADLPTDDSGVASGLFKSDTANHVQISVMKRDSEGTMLRFSDGSPMKIYKDIKTGWEYSIDLTVDNSQPVKVKALDDAVPFTPSTNPSEPVVEEVVEPVVEEVVKEEVKEESKPIEENKETLANKDAQINNIKDQNWTTIVFIALTVLIILIIFFLIIFLAIYLYKKRKDAVSSKVYFGSPMKSNLTSKDERILKDAQNRLRSAEEDIRKVLNKEDIKRKPDNRIKELERKLDEERRELDKLKRRY
ncbi:MAG: hypothetical protein WC867_07705 [Candidatus Pacearchaeota archaeon]|jgi:ABC-type Na+ efflux pump permease subunit